MRAVFVGLLEGPGVLTEGLAAFLADEGHIEALEEWVVFGFVMAFGTVEPFAAARGADGDLCVEDVITVCRSELLEVLGTMEGKEESLTTLWDGPRTQLLFNHIEPLLGVELFAVSRIVEERRFKRIIG
jgi:hypothetical protein